MLSFFTPLQKGEGWKDRTRASLSGGGQEVVWDEREIGLGGGGSSQDRFANLGHRCLAVARGLWASGWDQPAWLQLPCRQTARWHPLRRRTCRTLVRSWAAFALQPPHVASL